MVFSGKVVVSTVKISAMALQIVTCLPQRLTNEELINLLFRFPLEQIQRLGRCLCIFVLTPPSLEMRSGYHDNEDDNSDDHRYTTC